MRVVPLFLLSASTLALTATTAVAEPNYSTAGCVPSGAPNASVRYNLNFVFNDSSTADAEILCPVLKHERHESRFVFGATVTVIDRDTEGEVLCTLASLTRSGTRGGFEFVSVGSDRDFADSVPQELSLPQVFSHARGFYALSCDIPKKIGVNERSGLLTYAVPELAPF